MIEAYCEEAHPVRLIENQGWIAYWLMPGRFAAGVHPTLKQAKQLQEEGVTAFVDLTEAGEIEDYRPALTPDAVYVQHQIVDMTTPQSSGMREILDQLHQLVADGDVPYVHCWAGIGRTGTVLGCYLVEVGFTAAEALDIIQLLRTGGLTGRRISPQTSRQVQFVHDWETNHGSENDH